MEESIRRVIATLEELQVEWCLIGAHAIGEYTEPRATEDVDLLIDDRRIGKLLAVLRERLGDLDEDDIGPAVRLRALRIDLVRASSNDVFRAALASATSVQDWRLPIPAALLVMKFMAATSPFRGIDRRRQDMVALIRLYRALDPADVDRSAVGVLAKMIYAAADEELFALLDKIDRDEPITI